MGIPDGVSEPALMAQKGILSYNVKDKQELYAAYMPFLINGGLFVPTRKKFGLGDEVLILLGLMDEERIAIPGKVAWLTPPGASTASTAVSVCSFPTLPRVSRPRAPSFRTLPACSTATVRHEPSDQDHISRTPWPHRRACGNAHASRMKERAIIHVDMDAFYASVEQRDNPALRGRPVMVGGSGRRGVVAAASYEARQYGVRSAMPAARAKRLCPSGVFVAPRFERYREVSAGIFAIFRDWTALVEGLSLDEAFLDVTEAVAAGYPIRAIGLDIKRRIADESGLTASVGMAHNKLLAKIASDYDKPDGLFQIEPAAVQRYLDPLPVQRIWGIGPRSAERLNDAGIYTAGQLRQTGIDVLERLFGEHGHDLRLRAAGIDERVVNPQRERRSVSQESTLGEDLHRLEDIVSLIEQQSAKVSARLAAERPLRSDSDAQAAFWKLFHVYPKPVAGRVHSFGAGDHYHRLHDAQALGQMANQILGATGWRRGVGSGRAPR
jgi:DNA polymerase IV